MIQLFFLRYLFPASFLLLPLGLFAQSVNWKRIPEQKHIFGASTGLEYSIFAGVHYGYVLPVKQTYLVPSIRITLPPGKDISDDYAVNIGVSGRIWQRNSWIMDGKLTLTQRKLENPMVHMNNFGTQTEVSIGWYRPKWFVAAQVGLDLALVTRLEHTDVYQNNYAGVKDGWYRTTGNNFMAGAKTGVNFKRLEINLSLGIVRTNGFRSSPMLPFTGIVGINYYLPAKSD